MSKPETIPPALLLTRTPGRETVAAGVWLTRGASHDPVEMAGATHLIEHLMLRSCGGRDRRELASLVDRLGGEVDAWTSSEMVGVSVNTTVDGLGEALDLLADAVLEPTFAAADVELERRVIRAEMALAADDPVAQVEEAILRAAWGDHALARPVIGSPEALDTLTPEALQRHHRELVRPGGLLAAVVGDFELDAVRRRLERLPLADQPRMAELPALEWRGEHLHLSREGQDQIHARLAFPAPAVRDPRLPALIVLNRILGDGAASRLFQRLREDKGLTYDVWSGPVLRRQGGLLEVGWACAPTAFEASLELVTTELRRASQDLREEEVRIAKEGLLRGLRMDLELATGWCSLDVGEFLDRGRRFEPRRAVSELEQVSLGQVQALAEEILVSERMASAICAPEGAVARVA
ncbi:MAG: pitrilysin family protein [Holophagae bacterium]